MCQPVNSLEITILPDGRIKIETGNFAGAAHTSAERFLQTLIAELGSTVDERVSLGHVHHTHHDHEHDAEHLTAGVGKK